MVVLEVGEASGSMLAVVVIVVLGVVGGQESVRIRVVLLDRGETRYGSRIFRLGLRPDTSILQEGRYTERGLQIRREACTGSIELIH